VTFNLGLTQDEQARFDTHFIGRAQRGITIGEGHIATGKVVGEPENDVRIVAECAEALPALRKEIARSLRSVGSTSVEVALQSFDSSAACHMETVQTP
jgi:hypothetical protein